MRRFNLPLGAYTVRGVDDWLCFLTDAEGNWFYHAVECDPLWRELPDNANRYCTGLGRGTGNPDTPKHRVAAAEAIALIGLRKIQLGHAPRPVDADCVADCVRLFG